MIQFIPVYLHKRRSMYGLFFVNRAKCAKVLITVFNWCNVLQ
ncbi:hypothetical protein HMPREF0091_10053 [Fannyhessea vaginae DSM 15829]|uniref:Transposase n=1 Tax=Fannyhessea vaginae DSM 15829 TaxID=525256 RepID=F1T585_9ACTN|nr:hypothetical protein HMPREF0091_10053 [Fannyhessea vaginae DSM 15829]